MKHTAGKTPSLFLCYPSMYLFFFWLCAEIWQLPCFNLEIPPLCMELWEKRYNEYLAEMRQVMSMEHDSKESKDWMANKIFQKYKQVSILEFC